MIKFRIFSLSFFRRTLSRVQIAYSYLFSSRAGETLEK